jgi:methylated-DNA-[protein]-cysteine S-methyltransferase
VAHLDQVGNTSSKYSPRFHIPFSVGSALRNNPFAPFVSCHRIIASDHFIGGFCGQWGLTGSDAQIKSATKKAKTNGNAGKEDSVLKKMTMLAEEGVGFDLKGKVLDAYRVIWKPAEAEQ